MTVLIIALGMYGVDNYGSADEAAALRAGRTRQQVSGKSSAGRDKPAKAAVQHKTNKPSSLPQKAIKKSAVGIRALSCDSDAPLHTGLSTAQAPQLRKLAAYEQACHGAVATKLSFFVPTPMTKQEATAYAADVAAKLREFAKYDIAPLVFMEPNTSAGILNFKDYRSGKFDGALDAYFAALKADGITDRTMGTWVTFPEANIPVWNTTNASDFAANVTKTVQFQKKYFPASKASILLDSQSYPDGAGWVGGQYVSLVPYVRDIPKGLIDSFGLQGFPWTPPAGQTGASLNPKSFLRIDLAAAAAKALGIKNVWLNTGTIARAYAQDPAQTVTFTAKQRQVMLDGIVAQAKALRSYGMSPSVHLFAEDKSDTAEGIDWSYLGKDDDQAAILKTFIHDLQAADVPLWLFDTM